MDLQYQGESLLGGEGTGSLTMRRIGSLSKEGVPFALNCRLTRRRFFCCESDRISSRKCWSRMAVGYRARDRTPFVNILPLTAGFSDLDVMTVESEEAVNALSQTSGWIGDGLMLPGQHATYWCRPAGGVMRFGASGSIGDAEIAAALHAVRNDIARGKIKIRGKLRYSLVVGSGVTDRFWIAVTDLVPTKWFVTPG